MTRWLSLLVSLLPLPATADCLDRTALDDGVLVTFADASKTLFTRVEGNLLRVSTPPEWNNETARLPHQQIVEAHFGLYVTRSQKVGFGGRVAEFDAASAQQPPEPEMGLRIETTLPPIDANYAFGLPSGAIGYNIAEGPLLVLPVGQCQYQTLQIAIDWRHDGNIVKDGNELTYFPELGFGLRLLGQQIVSISQTR